LAEILRIEYILRFIFAFKSQNGFFAAYKSILIRFKMPRNTTGGSGHRSQRNSEGAKAKHNRCLIDDLLDDIRNDEKLSDIHIARVTKRMGNGRMEVIYFEATGSGPRVVQQIVPMRGGLKGRAKKTVWVDIDSLVMIAATGLAGTSHEIVAVFLPEQIARLRKMNPALDERLFLKSGGESDVAEGGFEFEDVKDESAEVNVDNI
jgi:hypothetical protein